MAYNVKPGADIARLHPKMWEVLPMIEQCFVENSDGGEFLITEGWTDGPGVHGGGDADATLHDDGLAVDIRTRHLAEHRKEIVRDVINNKLGRLGVQAVLEPTHLHVEREGVL